jgi:hypothetical protein
MAIAIDRNGASDRIAPEALGPTITVGEILVEIMATTIGDGFVEAQSLVGPFPSGAPAIFIDQVAKLRGSAGIIAAVGRDDFGQVNLRRLKADGADISAIAVHADYPTGTAFVRYREDGGRDFVYNIARSAAGLVQLTDSARALIARAGHLHVMGSAFSIPNAWSIIEFAAGEIKARGGSLSFDPNMRKELMDGNEARAKFAAILDMTDLLLPSGDELFLLAPGQSEAGAIEALLKRGIGELVLKRGENGASLFTAKESLHRRAFSVAEIDPTGAGDCFGATYLTCRRLGFSGEKSLAYANASGARAVTVKGPMEGTSGFAELDALIAASGG